MVFSSYIQERLQQKCGVVLRGPSDVERLTLDIETVTGEHIGVNTMKRLLGMIDDEREPRLSTLDIVAHYLGHEDWEELQLFDKRSNSDFGDDDEGVLKAASLPECSSISVSYPPDRVLRLRHQGNGCFLVEQSEQSKLQVGDEIAVTHFVRGYPLLVSEVKRSGRSLGSFIAGKKRGIDFQLL